MFWYNGFCDNEMRENFLKVLFKEFLIVVYRLSKFLRCYYDLFLFIIEKWFGVLIMKYSCIEKEKEVCGIIFEIVLCIYICCII